MEKETKKIEYEAISNLGEYTIKIIDQTHIGDNFGVINNEFKAKNGILLRSDYYPEFRPFANIFYTIGKEESKNDTIVHIYSKAEFIRIIEALDEYNEYFKCEKDKVRKMKNKKIDFISEWNEKFECGFIKLKKINDDSLLGIKIEGLLNNESINITKESNPEIKIYFPNLGGFIFSKDYVHTIIKKDFFNSVVETLNKLNEYNKISYKELHKKLWLGISEGKDKIKYYTELCKEYELETYNDCCFLCDQNRAKYKTRNCLDCSGKWFSIKLLDYGDHMSCMSNGSYFQLWHHEKDPELKKALAIRIANLFD